MDTPVAPTYLLPDDEAVLLGPWLDHGGLEIRDRVEHWDPVTDLELTRAATVDLDAARSQCALGADSAFALIAEWRAPSRTRLGGAGKPVELGHLTGVGRAPISVNVPGREAGGRLDLTVRLVLRSCGSDPTPISPRRLGAILWTDTERVMLEGSAARFPTAAVDFGAVPKVPDAAAWYLDWNVADLEHPVMGGLRLLLNRTNPRIVSAVRSTSDDPAAPLIRSIIRSDIARQLIRAALSSDEFMDSPDSFADDSVGRLIRDLIASIWTGIPIDAIRERALQDPARFDADVQAALEVLG
jgi:hypothetical protein